MSAAWLAAAATVAASLGIESLAARPRRPVPLAALPARLAVLAVLWLLWLGLFERPLLAATATLVTQGVLAAISRQKRRLVGEPLVFSDFGLIRLVIRHPDLYYTDVVRSPAALAAFAALAFAIAAWIWLEPALVGLAGATGLLALVAALVAGAWSAARLPPAASWLARVLPRPDLEGHVAAWGLLLTLVAYALRWRGETAQPWLARGPASAPAYATDGVDLVLVVQLESFVDLARRAGSAPAPGLAAARSKAIVHGSLAVPAHGAYTMRSEFAVLSGLSSEDLGFRRFDPFLSVVAGGAPVPATLAGTLAARGWRTLFVHPFRPGFFDRERVMRRLGFARLLWEGDFAEVDRRGPYIGDEALARRLLAETDAMEKPAFAMAVTMENHGPWTVGRLPGIDDPAAQYREHLAGSDRAIAILVDGLSRRPGRALLCLYGDHPPILPEFDAAAPPETDYAVLELGKGAALAEPREVPLSADALGRLLADLTAPAAPRPS